MRLALEGLRWASAALASDADSKDTEANRGHPLMTPGTPARGLEFPVGLPRGPGSGSLPSYRSLEVSLRPGGGRPPSATGGY